MTFILYVKKQVFLRFKGVIMLKYFIYKGFMYPKIYPKINLNLAWLGLLAMPKTIGENIVCVARLLSSCEKMTNSELIHRLEFEYRMFKQGSLNPLRNFILRACIQTLQGRTLSEYELERYTLIHGILKEEYFKHSSLDKVYNKE